MNSETAQNPFPTSADLQSSNGLNGGAGIHKVAQTLHETVDTLEQKLGTGTDKVMAFQQEYGEMARDQIRANPLAALGVAFAVGYVFAKAFSK